MPLFLAVGATLLALEEKNLSPTLLNRDERHVASSPLL
jgi:hypothetical protein